MIDASLFGQLRLRPSPSFAQGSDTAARVIHAIKCAAPIKKTYVQAHMGAAIMFGMTKDEAVQHFGTQTALAQALGLDQSTVSGWGSFPPPLRQLQIERLTSSQLKAEPECDRFRVPA